MKLDSPHTHPGGADNNPTIFPNILVQFKGYICSACNTLSYQSPIHSDVRSRNKLLSASTVSPLDRLHDTGQPSLTLLDRAQDLNACLQDLCFDAAVREAPLFKSADIFGPILGDENTPRSTPVTAAVDQAPIPAVACNTAGPLRVAQAAVNAPASGQTMSEPDYTKVGTGVSGSLERNL